MTSENVYNMKFGKIYPLLVNERANPPAMLGRIV